MNMRYFHISLGLIPIVLLFLLFTAPGLAQTSDEWKSLKKGIEELKESQKAIKKDLQEIKKVLRSHGLLDEVPPNLFIDISGKPFRGNKNAKVTVIEFSEYQ